LIRREEKCGFLIGVKRHTASGTGMRKGKVTLEGRGGETSPRLLDRSWWPELGDRLKKVRKRSNTFR